MSRPPVARALYAQRASRSGGFWSRQAHELTQITGNESAMKPSPMTPHTNWLDVVAIARVSASSEDPRAPAVQAFALDNPTGWRAAVPGVQTIDVTFHQPRDLRRVRLVFEVDCTCTHEFALSWIGSEGEREIVRQQFNFAEGGASREVEEYRVELRQIESLHFRITPDISGAAIVASLRQCQIA